MGFRPSKLSPPDGWPDAFAPPPHLRRYPTDPRTLHAAGHRHRQDRLPGFHPDERPWPAHPLFTGDELDAPLGFVALQGSSTTEHAQRVSPPSSPHALPRRQAAPAPQGLDAHVADLTRRPGAGSSRTADPDNPHGLCSPPPSAEFAPDAVRAHGFTAREASRYRPTFTRAKDHPRGAAAAPGMAVRRLATSWWQLQIGRAHV